MERPVRSRIPAHGHAGRRVIATGAPTDDLLDHRSIDWGHVESSRFLLRQRLRYEYDTPVTSLRHRLMLVPPARHGDQSRTAYGLEVTGAEATVTEAHDRFGNHDVSIRASRVDEAVEFSSWVVVERRAGDGPTRVPAATLHDPRLLDPTPLTWPDSALTSAAEHLAASGDTGLTLARRINAWVSKVMRYRHDVTNVDTTAARALGLAQGVCQDYTHVMLALCRLNGLPARYVSGHLLGEGGSHAWLEVVVPDPEDPTGATGPGAWAVAVPFDPTNGREVGPEYLTVAVGRDYSDVAPTYGTFRGDSPGRLTTVKRLGVTSYQPRVS
jgi:transglutaminase-like putative cysteine protease